MSDSKAIETWLNQLTNDELIKIRAFAFRNMNALKLQIQARVLCDFDATRLTVLSSITAFFDGASWYSRFLTWEETLDLKGRDKTLESKADAKAKASHFYVLASYPMKDQVKAALVRFPYMTKVIKGQDVLADISAQELRKAILEAN